MTVNGWIQILVFFAILVVLVKPLGWDMTRGFQRRTHAALARPSPHRGCPLQACRNQCREEQHWLTYTLAMLMFNLAGFVLLYGLQRLQAVALQPDGYGQRRPDMSFNTAVSFMSNTNWQSYVGESTMSYFVQMAALAVQNFVSAAAGIAVAVALVRGFSLATRRKDRQFSGSTYARHAVHPASAVHRRDARPISQGATQNAPAVHGRHHHRSA